MINPNELSTLYQGGNEFWGEPHKYDYISLYQEGEMYNCYNYVIPEHTQICCEISYIISGSGRMLGGGREHQVKTGDLFLNYPGEKHYILPEKQENLRYFYLGFNMDEDAIKNERALMDIWKFFSSPHANPVARCRFDTVSLMTRLNNEFYSADILSDMAVEYLLKQIIIDVYRNYNDMDVSSRTEKQSVSVGNAVYSALRYIDANIYELTRVQEIAQHLGYSSFYLSHLFKDKMGITIQQYLTLKKIEKSRELIKDGSLNLTQIAEMLSYDSIQSFSRVFKRVVGMSPSAYMKYEG